jgi:serine protein kinase
MSDDDRPTADLFALMRDTAVPAYERLYWEGSFDRYVDELVTPDPAPHVRTAYQLVRDMLAHFGQEQVDRDGDTYTRYRLFDDPFDGGRNALFGVEQVVDRLAGAIRAAAREEGKERILVLNGPVGTAKTSLLDLLCQGLEAYSREAAGAVYTFSWSVPRNLDADAGAGLGFGPSGGGESDEEFARVPCQMRDHPLLLIPRAERGRWLHALFASRWPDPANRPLIPRKILDGDLCFNCQAIARHLLRRAGGDWERVVKRVTVERFVMSELAGTGVAKVHPEGNVEGGAAILSFDENYKALAQVLWDVTLVRYAGKYVHGNRGVMHYSDLFKKPVVYLQHLLAAVEEHKVDFGEVGADVDVLIVGTTNEPEYLALRNNPVAYGLRSRIRLIDVPYLLHWPDEQRIYDQAMREAARATHIAPHTTQIAALWAVMTRLAPSQLGRDDSLGDAARRACGSLDPLQKTLLYAGLAPSTLAADDRKALTRDVRRTLRREFHREGMSGVSTRVIQNALADICEDESTPCVTPFRLFRALRRVISEGPEIHEFLARKPEGDYFDAQRQLELAEAWFDRQISDNLERSVIDVEPSELDDRIRDYLHHAQAFNAGGTPSASGDDAPDEARLRWIEDAIGVADDDREEFRFKVLARATEGVRDDEGGLNLRETYRDLYRAAVQGLYGDRQEQMRWDLIQRAFERGFDPDDPATGGANLDSGTTRACRTLLGNLTTKHGYCPACARDGVIYAVGKGLMD